MILVTGGSGAVGQRVVQGLLDTQQQVRILTRGGGDWVHNPLPNFRRLGVDIITGDVRDQSKVGRAITGIKAIIHLAAVIRGDDKEIQSVNVEGLLNLVAQASANQVQRFIYVSCLGATQFSTSKYLQTKYLGETMIRTSNFYWTIFRPSVLFGPGTALMRALDFCVSKTPFIPVMGSGLNQIQPVHADDVAACIVQSLYNRETVQKSYDLVGAESYSLTQLLEMSSAAFYGEAKPTLKLPMPLMFALANILASVNPSMPITPDMIRFLTTELTGDPEMMRNSFQVPMTSFEGQFKRIGAQR